MSVIPASSMRGPKARMNPFSQTGANITRSCTIFWIWYNISSRFFRSISWSWAAKSVSTSGMDPYESTPRAVANASRRGEGLPAGPGGPTNSALSFLLPPAEGRAPRPPPRTRHRAHARPDAYRVQVIRDGLAHRVVGREGRELARVEPGRIAGLGEKGLGSLWIVGIGWDGQRELLVSRHDVAGGAREAERL